MYSRATMHHRTELNRPPSEPGVSLCAVNLYGIVCVGLSIRPVCGLFSACLPPIVSVMEKLVPARNGTGRQHPCLQEDCFSFVRGVIKPAVNHVGGHETRRTVSQAAEMLEPRLLF